MSESKKIPSRNEIPADETWAMEDLFANDTLWQESFDRLKANLSGFSEFQGRLAENADILLRCLKYNDQVEEELERVYVYARQKQDEDTSLGKYQDFANRAGSLAVQLNGVSSFIVPEILAMDDARLDSFLESGNGLAHYKRMIAVIRRQKEHTLSAEMEKLLAASREVAEAPGQIYSMFNNADVQFPEIKDEEGEMVRLTQGRYISFLESRNREVREAAFKAMLGAYEAFQNTLAAAFQSNIKQASFYAKARNYISTRAYYLSDSNVPEAVYDNLIEAVHGSLPLMHRYVALRKRIMGLAELHMYDLYVPMAEGADKKYDYQKAKEMVKEGLKPLGEQYLNVLQEGFDNRWIDVRENKGKRTGAYSWGAYGTHPYVLLNYQDNLNNVFTLAHEMGHAIHSYYSDQHQPYTYAGYKIFVAEVASTCNESLLIRDLIAKTTDKKEKIYLVNDFLEKFRGTLFRQTMFAEFEMLTHRLVEEGKTLTPEVLCDLYRQLNEQYFGPDIIIDPEIAMEWARIPHFYTPFYVYQYATGFSAAIAISNRILAEGGKAVEDYFSFLSGGGSADPIDLLKRAGVDMTQKEPVAEAMKLFETLLDEMEMLIC